MGLYCMNAEMEAEKKLIIAEWIERAVDDFESAEILFKKTDNYEIVVYHCHQAIERKERIVGTGFFC